MDQTNEPVKRRRHRTHSKAKSAGTQKGVNVLIAVVILLVLAVLVTLIYFLNDARPA